MRTMNSIQINLRLPEEVASDLDKLAQQEHATRIDVACRILMEGVSVRKRAGAPELYRQGKASRSKAAEVAGISLWEMMDLIEQQGGPSPYNLREAVEKVRRPVARAGVA